MYTSHVLTHHIQRNTLTHTHTHTHTHWNRYDASLASLASLKAKLKVSQSENVSLRRQVSTFTSTMQATMEAVTPSSRRDSIDSMRRDMQDNRRDDGRDDGRNDGRYDQRGRPVLTTMGTTRAAVGAYPYSESHVLPGDDELVSTTDDWASEASRPRPSTLPSSDVTFPRSDDEGRLLAPGAPSIASPFDALASSMGYREGAVGAEGAEGAVGAAIHRRMREGGVASGVLDSGGDRVWGGDVGRVDDSGENRGEGGGEGRAGEVVRGDNGVDVSRCAGTVGSGREDALNKRHTVASDVSAAPPKVIRYGPAAVQAIRGRSQLNAWKHSGAGGSNSGRGSGAARNTILPSGPSGHYATRRSGAAPVARTRAFEGLPLQPSSAVRTRRGPYSHS